MVCEKEQVYMRYCIIEDRKGYKDRQRKRCTSNPAKELTADGGMRSLLLVIMDGDKMNTSYGIG